MSDAPKLPTPLEYDYVDYLIDRDTRFEQRESKDDNGFPELLWSSAFPNTLHVGGQYIHTHSPSYRQQMWQLKYEEYIDDKFLDDDGYIYWEETGEAMNWKADWTDEDTESWLDGYFGPEVDDDDF